MSTGVRAVKVRFEASAAKDVLALSVASDAYWSMGGGVVSIEANTASFATPKCADFV